MKRLFTVLLVLATPIAAAAQATRGSAIPRTAWGDPDLQGVWDYWTFTPLERPKEFAGKATLTPASIHVQLIGSKPPRV